MDVGTIWIIVLVVIFFILSRFVSRLETRMFMPIVDLLLTIAAIIIAIVYGKYFFFVLALLGAVATIRTAGKSGLIKRFRG